MRTFILCFLLTISTTIHSQENSLVIRYDFSEKSSPPMLPFYLRVYVNNILMDSTKPHSPSHNLANAVRINLEKGDHEIRIQGIAIDKRDNIDELSQVMEWKENIKISKGKSRIVFKLNSSYKIESYTITE